MTGEMSWIDQDGLDSNGDVWEMHAAIANAVGGKLQPFDVYQGPYIVVGGDLRAGQGSYAAPVQNLGIKRLWIVPDEDDPDSGYCRIYREDTDEMSDPFWWCDKTVAIIHAKHLLEMEI